MVKKELQMAKEVVMTRMANNNKENNLTARMLAKETRRTKITNKERNKQRTRVKKTRCWRKLRPRARRLTAARITRRAWTIRRSTGRIPRAPREARAAPAMSTSPRQMATRCLTPIRKSPLLWQPRSRRTRLRLSKKRQAVK